MLFLKEKEFEKALITLIGDRGETPIAVLYERVRRAHDETVQTATQEAEQRGYIKGRKSTQKV